MATALDLKEPKHLAVLKALLCKADVLVPMGLTETKKLMTC